MEILLTPELEQLIANQIETGQYASPSEVIWAGVKLLQEINRIYQGRYAELQKEVQIGTEAANRGELLDAEVVFGHLEQKLRAKRGLR
ncbi:type II toxin-antitoxin system ParD family antitoxin [Roseofilum sp. BLCC_M154]|uniref:Type II toxin-antitoxin system ParD family antitoxin n=1 Tax=Roseofilum acuticapitatum BLCC-M154 TaxID=3022444 RepID=A0ABT7AQA3_9CYAN|nr:type II toxin-antitoxin system ParD family antitoxin [Roseofilum acuticapitatum]MDJ1169080.1 type II toxin-antitoxin system ParD family antitoxin [Roseofilum acuticapitatum BLCC-M154]